MTSPFCFAKNASWCLLLWPLPLNRIHLKIISAATFLIIGLTKIVARLDLPNNDVDKLTKSVCVKYDIRMS